MLDAKQRRALKALAHPKKPIINVGKKGVTQPLVDELGRALFDHELVKVKFLEYDDLKLDAQSLADQAKAELVDVTGKIAVLYKAHPDEPRIKI